MFGFWLLDGVYSVAQRDVMALVMLYTIGIWAINLLFTLMYYNAYTLRTHLGLSPQEAFETKSYCYINLYTTSVATVVILVSLPLDQGSGAAQSLWALMAGVRIMTSRRKRIFKQKFGSIPELEPQLGTDA